MKGWLIIGEGSSTAKLRIGFGLTGSGPVLGQNIGDGSETGYGGNGRNSWRHNKLDMLFFNGSNPDGWILRAERIFTFYGLMEQWWRWRGRPSSGFNGNIVGVL